MPDLRLAVGTVLDWPVDHVAAAVVTDGRHRHRGRDRPGVPARLGDEAAHRLRHAHRGGGGRGRLGHPGRAARLHRAPPRRARVGALVLRRQGPGQARDPADLLQRRLRRAGRGRRRGRGHAVRRVPARGRLRAAGHDGHAADGSPGSEAESSVDDLARFAAELRAPTLTATLDDATRVAFPGLDGILPGFGRQKPNDWGLGFEIRDGKSPHWTGAHSSPRTFGHFGQSGTFLWVDPDAARPRWCSPTGTSGRGRSRPGRSGRMAYWRHSGAHWSTLLAGN